MWNLYWRYIISFTLGGLFAVSSIAYFLTRGLQSWLALFVAILSIFMFYLVIDK